MNLIKEELIEDHFGSYTLFVHESCGRSCRKKEVIHLLPAYDEYLISYKDRSSVIDPQYYRKAFNNYGIFQNVILFQGKIVGNWERSVKKGQIDCKHTPFTEDHSIPENLFKKAVNRYRFFYR